MIEHGIVLIDDDVDPVFYEESICDQYSYAISDSLEAISETFEETDINVVEQRLDETALREVVSSVRNWQHTPYIIVTTSSDPTPAILSVACDDYLMKPVDTSHVRAAIDRATSLVDFSGEIREAVSLLRKTAVLETCCSPAELDRNQEYRRVRTRLQELIEPEIVRKIEQIDAGLVRTLLQTASEVCEDDRRTPSTGDRTPTGGDRTTSGPQPWKFYETVESAGHGVIFADSDGIIEYVNPAFEEMTGYTADEAVGETPSIVSSGFHDDEFYADLWKTITSGDAWEGELVNERANGERYVVEQTIAPLPREGSAQGFVAITTEITDERTREEKVESLHDATRSLFAGDNPADIAGEVGSALESILDCPINVVRIREEDTLQPRYVSDRTEALLGDRPRYEIGEGIAGEAFETGTTRVSADVRDHDAGSELDPVRSWLYVPIEGHGVISVGNRAPDAFDDHDLAPMHLLASYAEIALDRLEYERELERENERLERFASTIAHDLRNPLQVAEGTLSQLQGGSGQVDRIRESHERMEEVIEGVLTLTREGDRVDDPAPVSIPDVATTCWRHVSTDCSTLEIESDSFVVEGDDTRLKHLFENLFRNALVHGQASTIRVGPLERGFFVADDGAGIHPEKRETVFDAGYSADEDGTGLGLAIVREIAQAHDWQVSVTESATGGARFEFLGARRAC